MKKYWIFGIILFISLFFRLINLDKSGGLWYDEAVIYSIASQKGIAGMLGADAHRFLLFPLYFEHRTDFGKLRFYTPDTNRFA